MDILQIEDLTFTYPQADKPVLNHFSLNVKQGDFIVLCGVSGCGKTTLLRLIKKQLAPNGNTEGTIFYRGTPISELDLKRSACEIGFVRQDPDLQIVTDRVWHELAFGLENMGFDTQTIRRRVGEMACFFGIDNWFRKRTDALSGGQKQLLNLASVMVMQPELLLLDEPTSQLDPIATADFIATLQKLNRELGLTVILVEHRLEEVFSIADKVCLMEQGRVLFYDSPSQVGSLLTQTSPAHPMTGSLPSAARIFNGLCAGGWPSGAEECPLTVRDGRFFLSGHFHSDTAVTNRSDDLPKGNPAAELSAVWFRYDKDGPDILEDLSLTIYEGEFFALLGGNGSGKSTLINVLTGISKAYHGSIRFFGRPMKSYRKAELFLQNLAVLPQNPHFMFIHDRIREDYEQMCETMQLSQQEAAKEIARVSELLQISSILDSHPYDVSGGELQRAALGKILLLKPRLLLLDEPTKGMDAHAKSVLGRHLQQMQQHGVTIFLVTHDVEFAAYYATRCGLLFDRQITSIGNPVTFFADNNFYTTAANRMARRLFPQAITCEDVIKRCRAQMHTTKKESL